MYIAEPSSAWLKIHLARSMCMLIGRAEGPLGQTCGAMVTHRQIGRGKLITIWKSAARSGCGALRNRLWPRRIPLKRSGVLANSLLALVEIVDG
ncbi:hypothetical protein R1flu_017319 [Riccia fluitans]|uniref:Ribosomal protein L14 n=1 Tax=Riccia fluitans TaxID=41844 RepID=A0ABD1ZF25_9MARC